MRLEREYKRVNICRKGGVDLSVPQFIIDKSPRGDPGGLRGHKSAVADEQTDFNNHLGGPLLSDCDTYVPDWGLFQIGLLRFDNPVHQTNTFIVVDGGYGGWTSVMMINIV